MYKIKRHKLLNLQYLHDPYSGPITDEYEVIDKAETWSEAYRKLKKYQENSSPNIDGIFEDYYKYEHMKEVWGDPIGVQPSIGQLFFIYYKEMFGQMRTLFELCRVQIIEEPYVTFYNQAANKQDKMTVAQFQGNALIPERDESFIQFWESKVKIRYPKNLISKLKDCQDYNALRPYRIILSQHRREWDLPKQGLGKFRKSNGV